MSRCPPVPCSTCAGRQRISDAEEFDDPLGNCSSDRKGRHPPPWPSARGRVHARDRTCRGSNMMIAWERLCDTFAHLAYAPGNDFRHQGGIMLGIHRLLLNLTPA